ncbi:MAG: DUF2188 domain-containing protein [Anaerolineae bacterium]|nr:DUF2188 domain-containing protein [Anaerolineae bacterium]
MAKRKNQHVVKRTQGWAVVGSGNKKATKVVPTQKEAIELGRQIAKNQRSELIVHDKKGRIRSKDSYGNDPNPPKDKEH